ncbi:MAG: response regulator [Gammaproteobacteria bacterium]|nr:MAG: response regulator [Gammaproteobacteria bacterium]
MAAKRALIVDDSKSARLFLARILEKYEIGVDNADSAEAAIQYLGSHIPDVIFMDHLMPGMDGFQAVRAIKNNPRTATIPIMMFTSDEGELYLGQARALGAVGVLPKQIKPTDVSKVLYQLHLVPERRGDAQATLQTLDLSAEQAEEQPLAQHSADISGVRPPMETTLREQFAELRRALVAGIDTQTDRIVAEVRSLLNEALPPPPSAAEPMPPPRPPVQWGWIVAGAAVAITLGSVALWWRNMSELNTVRLELTQLRRALTERQATPPAAREPAAHEPVSEGAAAGALPEAEPPAQAAGAAQKPPLPTQAKPMIVPLPYGAEAFSGPRLETIRQLLYRLTKESVAGVVEIKTFAGRFCLVGNATDGFSLAPDETPAGKCDLLGNPAEDAPAAQRTPLALANLMGEIRNSSRGRLDVQASVGDAAITIAPYPQVTNDLTAGEWNRAGSANNRIEIRWH